MPVRRLLIAPALLAISSFPLLEAAAQHSSAYRARGATRQRQSAVTGLITTRLSERQLRRWRAIERLVFARDEAGLPLHSTLQSLWEWAESCPHAIYVELPDRGGYRGTGAGKFKIEKFDPAGKRHVAVIRLRLSVIDSAASDKTVARANGFIPFSGLRRYERYAEVLGHELAHAQTILSDLRTAKLIYETVEQTNTLFTAYYLQRNGRPPGRQLKQRLIRRDSLLQKFEVIAESVEEAVWQELINSQNVRAGSSRP
jgi:hypothetical protein